MDSSSADLLAPSLRHFPDAEKDSNSLEHLIQRLNVQRGHFRTVTEEQLDQEIAEGKDNEDDDASEASASADSKDEDGEDMKTVDEIYAAKAEMFTAIAQAQNEALLALDFISLLLSKDAPIQGRQTMSHALTQLVPSGTLAYDKWPLNEPSSEEKESERAVTLGWQVESIESSADSLAKASQRLQKGVQHEQTYWDELLAIAERGYAVARIHPVRQRHIFGAQVGFMDAGPFFKGRGFATLHRNDEGHINLDKELSRSPKSLRVRVVEEGKMVGVSMLPPIKDTQPPIDEIVDRARSSLFEEELFHEMTMETRILLPYNVSLRDNTIHLPIKLGRPSSTDEDGSSSYVLLDLVPREEKHAHDHGSMDSMARYFAISLRILLCYTYRQKLRLRSRPPPPLSDRERPSPPHAILRPLINHCSHVNVVDRLQSYFKQVTRVLGSANINLDAKFASQLRFSTEVNENPSNGSVPQSSIDHLVNNLTNPLVTTITINLPSSRSSPSSQPLLLSVKTHLSPEAYGTRYDLELPASVASVHGLEAGTQGLKKFTYRSFDELRSYLNLIIGTDIVHGLLCPRYPGWNTERGVSEASKLTADGNYEVFSVDVSEAGLSIRYNRESAGNVNTQDWTGENGPPSFQDFLSTAFEAGQATNGAS